MKLLLVEDNAADARLIREMLKDSAAGIRAMQQVARLDAALELLDEEIFDVALLDLSLPDSQGLSTLVQIQAAGAGLPIVVLTGVDDDEFALEIVRAGAQDYLVKGRVTGELLVRTLRYAIERKHAEEEIRQLNAQLEQRVRERTAELQAANEALQLSQRIAATHLAQLRTTLDNLAEAVYVCDAAGRPLLTNPSFERLTAMTAQTMPQDRVGIVSQFPLYELSGEPVRTDDRPANAALHGEIVSGRELRLAGCPGGDKIVRYNGAPVRDPQGSIIMAVLSIEDVTERKRAEEALRQSELRFRTMADAMPQLAWVANADGWIYWYNRRWYEYTGTTPEQMEGWGWQSVHDPHTLAAVLERWKGSIATGQPFDMVFPLRSSLGVFRPFLTRVLPLKDEQGRVLQWFGTNTDVSEQKAAEEALRAERDFNVAMLDTAAALVVVIDREGRILRINRACEPVTGYTPVELCGRPVWDLVPREDALEVRQVWESLCAGNFPNQHENHWMAKDGSYRLISWSNTALVGADGTVEYVIATGVDLTDHRKAEQALIRSEKLVLVGRMAATIAHEINNPLAAAINSLYLAQTEESLSATARQSLAMVDKQLARVAHITKQTLGFYREAREVQGVQLAEILDGVLDLYGPKMQDKAVRVDRVYATPVSVQAVEGELRQVLSNLIANSIDAVEANGTLWVRTSAVQSWNDRPMVCVTIADSGCGIPRDNLKRIFEPFFTTKQAYGTGLGLWVTKELVEKQNGRIRVRSKPGKGAVFAIWLPTERRSEARIGVA